jgi:hypothetical protein
LVLAALDARPASLEEAFHAVASAGRLAFASAFLPLVFSAAAFAPALDGLPPYPGPCTGGSTRPAPPPPNQI